MKTTKKVKKEVNKQAMKKKKKKVKKIAYQDSYFYTKITRGNQSKSTKKEK